MTALPYILAALGAIIAIAGFGHALVAELALRGARRNITGLVSDRAAGWRRAGELADQLRAIRRQRSETTRSGNVTRKARDAAKIAEKAAQLRAEVTNGAR